MEELRKLSQFKSEYLELSVPALIEGNVNDDFKLGSFKGQTIALLFYPADFTPLPREELLEMISVHTKLKEKNCQIAAVSVDSVHVHQAWQNTVASDEADGLGRKTPFPLIGDTTQRLSRSLGVLDEVEGVAKHALLIVDPKGDVVHRDLVDKDRRIDFGKIVTAHLANSGNKSISAAGPDLNEIKKAPDSPQQLVKEEDIKIEPEAVDLKGKNIVTVEPVATEKTHNKADSAKKQETPEKPEGGKKKPVKKEKASDGNKQTEEDKGKDSKCCCVIM